MRGFRKVCPKSFTIADCAALCRCLMAYLPMWMAAITPRCIRLRWAPPIYAICNPHATYLKVRKECRVMLCVTVISRVRYPPWAIILKGRQPNPLSPNLVGCCCAGRLHTDHVLFCMRSHCCRDLDYHWSGIIKIILRSKPYIMFPRQLTFPHNNY